MRMWSWLGTAFVVVLLQTTSIGFFRGSLYFDLPLIFIYALALFYGPRVGLMAGVAFGLLQDLSSPSVFGFCILTRGAAGYLVGRVKEMIFKNNGAYHVLLIGSLSLGLRLLYAVLVLALSGSVAHTAGPYLMETLWYCLGNMVLTVPVERLLYRQFQWEQEEDSAYGQ